MYTKGSLYLLYSNDIVDADINTETPLSILNKLVLLNKSRYILSLIKRNEENNTTSTVAINLNRLFTFSLSSILIELSLDSAETLTWDMIASTITDQQYLACKVDVPDFNNKSKSLIFANVVGSREFELSYTNINYPTERNNKSQRWRLTDLSITKDLTNASTDLTTVIKDINFDNCLVSVNGVINNPIHFKDTIRNTDELLVKDGALYMTRNDEYNLPSVVLLDFSYLGNIKIIPFSECYIQNKTENQTTLEMLKKRPKKNNASIGHHVEFIFDMDIDLRNKTIFPVIAHSLYFPDVVTVTSAKTCVIPFSELNIKPALLRHSRYQKNTIRYTPTVFDNITINNYISVSMSTKEHYGGFFVIVDNKDIFIKKTRLPRYVVNARYLNNVKDVDGVVFNQTTQAFTEYRKNVYNNCTEIYTEPISDILDIDTLDTDLLYGLLNTTSTTFISSTKNYNDDDLYLINITKV